MPAFLSAQLVRLEALSLREKVMALVALPVVLLLAAEFLVYSAARSAAAEALKQTESQQGEIKALRDLLASRPAAAPLPGADQLQTERAVLQAQIDAAQTIVLGAERTVPWGMVVRATVVGTPGLTLTRLSTTPPELVYSPSAAKPATAASSATVLPTTTAVTAIKTISSKPPAAIDPPPGARGSMLGEAIYRHRAELVVSGNFDALLGYLQTLQKVPGDLHWERLALRVAVYPQASLQLALYTLSSRAETPFQ